MRLFDTLNIKGMAFPPVIEEWLETLEPEWRVVKLTVAELAKARVDRDRATASDKRKRLLNTIEPPKTDPRIHYLLGRDATYRSNRDANRGPWFVLRLQALAELESRDSERNCRCFAANGRLSVT